MKLSSEIKAEIAATEWARNLAKVAGYDGLARVAGNELMMLYGELDARTTKNRAQIEAYKNSTKGK
jgi:hypothetical protein